MPEEALQLDLFVAENGDEIRLSEKSAAAVVNYLHTVHSLAQMYASELTCDGHTEAEALSVMVQAQVRVAAYVACCIRRELLGGTPDYWTWKRVSDEAFRKAARASAPKDSDPEHHRAVSDA